MKLCVLAFACSQAAVTVCAQESPATLTVLENAREAVCLDGSPAAYYLRRGTANGVKKWLIYHEGGGWCTSWDDCVGRSKTSQGSSSKWWRRVNLTDWSNAFSEDSKANPMMHNWNAVLIPSCDGGGFSSYRSSLAEYNGTALYFRGKVIVDAVREDLLPKGLHEATDVVISGCSAGGLATYLTIDSWADALETPSRRVVGLPDSGFFPEYDGPPGVPETFKAGMEWVFNNMNCTAGVNKRCIDAHTATNNTVRCFFAEHVAPFIKTPLFVLQSEYDSAQLGMILGSTNVTAVNSWGARLTHLIEENLLARNDKPGAFLDSCSHHCGEWGHLYVGTKNQPAAFQEWYEQGSPVLKNRGYYAQAQQYPCKQCGCDSDELLNETQNLVV